MAADTALTPMMAQYRRIKGELPKDALLLFRLGDFYELFFEDAVSCSQILGLTLTKRNGIPMCGMPYHAANGYISRILRAGHKVAICDQTEEAKPGKLVQREVTAILSPGTHFDDRLLKAERNNFLAALHQHGGRFAIACVDLTTGDFRVTEQEDPKPILVEIDRLRPAELLFPSESKVLSEMAAAANTLCLGHDDWTFQPENAVYTLRNHFKVASLDGYGLRNRLAAIGAAGAVLHYLASHLRRDVSHLTRLTTYEVNDFLVLDATSLRNLEILEPLHADAPRNTTLFGAVNRTVTPMGARRLRDWLTQPLAAAGPIRRRQEAVEAWLSNPGVLADFRARLAEVRDLERTLSRISLGSGNARDLLGLRQALEQIPPLKDSAAALLPPFEEAPPLLEEGGPAATDTPPPLLQDLLSQVTVMPALVELLTRALAEDPPQTVREGGMIRDGFSAELDELRSAARGGKDWLAKLQQDEVARTGIPSLKVGFNSVFGYYIEVTKAHLAKVPGDYVRKQTVANGERYITQELKAMESKILGAEERGTKLEYDLFQKLREEVLAQLRPIQETASALAQLDVLGAFAETARLHGWTRPEVGDEGRLEIRDGRHPVLDQVMTDERFVPNDTALDPTENQVALITGPNMAGKSTYIRQVALLALLAHTGSFLPAKSARIDLCDRIFTRIGASDDLARGQSTFMVEMSETANILNNAGRRSLVILDEIGRGTSTFDGLSLAWSIVEHLHHQVGAKTLFATHYHELTELAADAPSTLARLPRVRNFNIAVREYNDQIVFLRKIQPGPADKSYGIQVARLAGVPSPVIGRAKEILRVLEEAELNLHQVAGTAPGSTGTPDAEADAEAKPKARKRNSAGRTALKGLAPSQQLDLFS